jgi:hypothetical protein
MRIFRAVFEHGSHADRLVVVVVVILDLVDTVVVDLLRSGSIMTYSSM